MRAYVHMHTSLIEVCTYRGSGVHAYIPMWCKTALSRCMHGSDIRFVFDWRSLALFLLAFRHSCLEIFAIHCRYHEVS